MKNILVKIAATGLFVVAIASTPLPSSAADTNAPNDAAAMPAKHRILPFHGKLAEVDTNAMTLTVGKHVIATTSETKVFKDGKPATLSEGVIGENVSGAYIKNEDGTWDAVTVHFGTNPGAKKKKESAPAN
jgi:hypothetical protein